MTDEQVPRAVASQQEIVRRYALELRQAACTSPRRPAEPRVRRCYELLNRCAMELAEADRLARAGSGSAVPTTG